MMVAPRWLPYLVEYYRQGTPLLLTGGMVGAIACLAWLGLFGASVVAWSLAGLAMLPLYEYALHRWVLHAPPLGGLTPVQVRLHYKHHADTQDLTHIFTPTWLTAFVLACQAAIYAALRVPLPIAAALFVGNCLAFLLFEWVHYIAHVPYTPHTAYGRFLKKYHLWHHHKNEHFWFGVTCPFMDRLFGTYRLVADVPTSATVRRLHGEPAD